MAKLQFSPFKGLDEYIEEIQRTGRDVDAAVARAASQGADVLLNDMQALVPVDEGDLQGELKVDGPHQDGNRIYIEIGLIDAPKEIAIYGNVQEFGSPSKNIPAQSYVRAAWDRMKSKIMQAVKASLQAEGMVS